MNSPNAKAHASDRVARAQVPDIRLQQLKAELDDHARIARYLGVDFQRAVSALDDGYPESAVAHVGKITERLLKQLWIHHGAPGTPAGKTLRDLIRGCRPYIRSQRVPDALHEIQRLRNRASHDGYPVAAEDGLVAIRRLLDVLDWYTSTGSGALTRHAPRLAPTAAAKAEWLVGLYLTLELLARQQTGTIPARRPAGPDPRAGSAVSSRTLPAPRCSGPEQCSRVTGGTIASVRQNTRARGANPFEARTFGIPTRPRCWYPTSRSMTWPAVPWSTSGTSGRPA